MPAKPNQKALESIFRDNDRAKLSIRLIPKANHFCMEAKTGTPEEISQLEKEFVPDFLEAVSDWILRNE